MACSCCREGAKPSYVRSAVPRATLAVAHGRTKTRIRLPALRVLREGGRRFVNLVDVWSATHFPFDLDELHFDLVGDDGFDTSTKRGAPLTGRMLSDAYVDVETRDVHWLIDVPCFYRLKGLATLVARTMAPLAVDGAE